MTDEKKKVPELRFPEFSGEWIKKELGSEVTFYSGLTYKPDDINEEGILVLRSSNIKNGKIIDADNVFVDSNKINSTFVNEGDVIVVVRNGSKKLIGKHARVNNKHLCAVIGAFMTGIRCYNSKFINSLLDTSNFYKEIHKNLGATINQITTGNFRKMKFYFPNDKEQQKIGEFFSKLDRQIELEEQKLEKLEELKKGYMQKIFSQELRFKDENGNDYPEWEEKLLSEIGDIVTGNTPSKKVEEYWESNDYIWVTPKDITNTKNIKNSFEKLSSKGFEKARKLPKNTLLVTCIASIGKNAILKKEGSCNQQINAVIPFSNSDIDYIYYAFDDLSKLMKK